MGWCFCVFEVVFCVCVALAPDGGGVLFDLGDMREGKGAGELV